jgi:uncharacterized protein with PIN domain
MNLSDKDKKKIMSTELKYEDCTQFLHCEHCLSEYLKEREANGGESEASPRDSFNYEPASAKFAYPDGTTANIFSVWCKKCGRLVWDSRHLTHLF